MKNLTPLFIGPPGTNWRVNYLLVINQFTKISAFLSRISKHFKSWSCFSWKSTYDHAAIIHNGIWIINKDIQFSIMYELKMYVKSFKNGKSKQTKKVRVYIWHNFSYHTRERDILSSQHNSRLGYLRYIGYKYYRVLCGLILI